MAMIALLAVYGRWLRRGLMPVEPFLSVDISHQLGKLALYAKFEVTAPWTVLFGPSGSGKSTILRSIAGLVRPEDGTVNLFEKRISGPGVWVPAHLRRVRWCGQKAALFPRMTIAGNLASGIGTGGGKSWIDDVGNALRVFGLEDVAKAYPAELSGGQQQKVSVVRAILGARGCVLLLDEPFFRA